MRVACGDVDASMGPSLDFHASPHLEGVADASCAVASDHYHLLVHSKVHFLTLLHECHFVIHEDACCSHPLTCQASCGVSHLYDVCGVA